MTERQALEDAFRAIYPSPKRSDEPEWQGPGTLREPLYHHWMTRWLRFTAMLDAEAYLDAAMMLVPKGWGWRIEWEDHHTVPAAAVVYRPDPADRHYVEPITCDGAPTPAAALLAAILDARSKVPA